MKANTDEAFAISPNLHVTLAVAIEPLDPSLTVVVVASSQFQLSSIDLVCYLFAVSAVAVENRWTNLLRDEIENFRQTSLRGKENVTSVSKGFE